MLPRKNKKKRKLGFLPFSRANATERDRPKKLRLAKRQRG